MDKRLTIAVNSDLHSQVKERANKLGLTMTDYIKSVLKDNLRFHVQDETINFDTMSYGDIRNLAHNSPNEVTRNRAMQEIRRRLIT